MSSSKNSAGAAGGGLPKMKFFDKSWLRTDNLFKLSAEETHREVAKIHSDLFSSSYFRQLGFDASPDGEKEDGSITMINSMSNTSSYEFREAEFQEETKYIKEPKPWGNPFRLIIRPRNQNIQMSEIEEEAMMTNNEKKKSNKLASYANLYKQHLRNQLKRYGEWFRANQDPATLDGKIRELQARHEADKMNMIRREEEVKRKVEKDKRFLDKRGLESLEMSDEEQAGSSLVKVEKVGPRDGLNKVRLASMLFDDLQELVAKMKDEVNCKDEIRLVLKKQLRVLSLKYQEYYESEFLAEKFEDWVADHFGYSF